MPVITLTSDFGTRDTIISRTRAFLMKKVPGKPILDITHQLAADDIFGASWVYKMAYPHFPQGSFHLLLLGVFSNSVARLLLAQKDGHYLLAPDNGFLQLAFQDTLEAVWLCKSYTEPVRLEEWLAEVQLVIEVIEGGGNLSKYFSKFPLHNIPRPTEPRPSKHGLECNILHFDRYGNIVLNITEQQFAKLVGKKPFSIRLPGETEDKIEINNKLVGYPYLTDKISTHYSEVGVDRLLCRFNSMGYLEVAINHGSAAAKLETKASLARNIVYRTMTIDVQPTI